jgi:hypothetical protein
LNVTEQRVRLTAETNVTTFGFVHASQNFKRPLFRKGTIFSSDERKSLFEKSCHKRRDLEKIKIVRVARFQKIL